MKNCFLKITDNRVFDELKAIIGENQTRVQNYINESYVNDSFSENFITWYQEQTNKQLKPEDISPKALARLIVEHYRHRRPDVNDTIADDLSNDAVSEFGYGNVSDREEGKQHAGTMILDMFNKVQQAGYEIKGSVLNYYVNNLKTRWNKCIFRAASKVSGLTYEEISAQYEAAEDKTAYLENILGGENISIENKNLLAVYKELNASKEKADKYIFEVFCDKDLQDVRTDLKDDLDSLITNLINNENAEVEGVNKGQDESSDEYDFDGMMAQYNSHMGTYSNFMKHIGPRIRTYFRTLYVPSSLEKIEDPNTKVKRYPINTDNRFGLPNTMDPTRCCSMLYSEVVWTNIPEAIRQIRLLSKRRGCEAFAQFADDLEADTDFATEVFTTFAKTIVEKLQLVVSDGVTAYKVSNQRSNKHATFLFNLMNDLRSSSLERDVDFMSVEINKLLTEIGSIEDNDIKTINNPDLSPKLKEELIKQLEFKRNAVLATLIKHIKAYFPSIEEVAVQAYVELNDDPQGDFGTQFKNIRRLTKNILNICETSADTQRVWRSRQAKIDQVKAYNAEVKRDADNGNWHDPEDYLDIDTLFDTDFLSESQKKHYRELASLLVEYSVVDVELNTPNVNGNNSSNVINNSYLTGLIKILNETTEEPVYNEKGELVTTVSRNKRLEEWGKEKLKSKQYKYSSILVEQYDKDGNPINDAIFKVDDNGNIIGLTEKAPYLLKLGYFDGSSDMDSGTNVTYDKMTQGDFLPTAFMSYFTVGDEPNIKQLFGNYFLRTPSDAPKTFSLRAPKYDVSELFITTDASALETKVNEIINNLPTIEGTQENVEKYATPTTLELNQKRLTKAILSDGNLWVEDTNAAKLIDEENEIYSVACRGYGGSRNKFYIFTGKLESRGGAKVLISPKYEGMMSADKDTMGKVDYNLPKKIDANLREYFKKSLNGKDVTFLGKTYKGVPRKINRNHKVYQILKNNFKQEMLDCAIAIDHYFETEGDERGYGWIKNYGTDEDGRKVIKLRKDRDNKKGYDFYHLGENGQVLEHITTQYVSDEYDNVILEKEYKELSKEEQKKYRAVPVDKYRLGGSVFHSSKFTLSVKDENGNEVKKNYLDEVVSQGRDSGGFYANIYDDLDVITAEEYNQLPDAEKANYEGYQKTDGKIHILYGGANTDSYLHTIKQDGKVVDVWFTEEQEARIERALDNFLKDYIDQAINKIEQYKNFIKGVSTEEEAVIDFSVNSLVMFMAYDDLFEGSPKFYKDSQTVLKRAKEYQGSGIPYGIADYTDVGMQVAADSIPDVEPRLSFLNSGYITPPKYDENGKEIRKGITIQDSFKGTILEGTTQRKRFVGVTVKNTKMTNDKALGQLKTQLVNQLVNSLRAEGLTKKAAEEYANNHVMDILYGPIQYNKDGSIKRDERDHPVRRGGFTDTKVNDAQSYITLNEWVRRVAARGQLKRYLPLINRLLDESQPLSTSDIKEFIQVQKNFYYDLHYDAEYGIEVPRQIKNAEFVLVPRLIKGTQLETVYNLMRQAGIDQLNTVETSKAANEQVLTLWDNEGNLTGADTFVNECATAKQVYDYNHLYTQQETPQHLNASNKAGIQIVKKIIDNIPEFINRKRNPLYDKKQEFFTLFVQNIRDSYDNLLDNLEVPRDENGNISFDEDGNIEGLNSEVFYNKLRDEMMRLGLDSNMIDYVTIDPDTGRPRMPAFMANVLTKFESVSQSLFNNTITRQKLPGFHAAQVTNIGWRAMGEQVTGRRYSEDLEYHPMQYINKENPKDIIAERDYKKLSTEERKQYKKHKPAGYIEIMLPLSNFGIDRDSEHYRDMTDDQILAELHEKGLDIIMGYRIPTEGKQSVCNMRVVGFTPDVYGSTIVVPNDWVSQTGSDFDIDSVYGIHYETYKTSDGEIHKIEYITKPDEYDWFAYIKRYGDKELDTAVKGKIKESVNGIKSFLNDIFKDLIKEEQKAYNGTKENNYEDALPDFIKDELREVDFEINNLYGATTDENRNEKFVARLNARIEVLTDILLDSEDQRGTDVYNKIDDYRKLLSAILNNVQGYAESYRNEKDARVSAILQSRMKEAEEKAAQYGLLSFEEYKALAASNPEQINSRKARNNRILDIMKDILMDDSSLEENLSRSNFDDIIYWRDQIMDANTKAERNNRSAYNVFDQIAYQEDAMSGAALKGMSVALDTWCSVCNTVQPELTEPIYIVYDAKDFANPNAVLKRFGHEQNYKKGDSFAIYHSSYGWSNDNRNVTGKILTAYSSQTTAHILDAIKEGAIPNVNTYTFATYKTLLNVGSDYKTAISFIMQPGVSRIVDNYNKTNSVFSDMQENPIHQAIKDIAENELGITVEFRTPVNAILNAINAHNDGEYKKIFNSIFKQSEDEADLEIKFEDKEIARIPLIVSKMVDRIQNKGFFENATPVEKALFDLGVILAFHKIHKSAGKIGNIARCCNPDKFGAKQTVFATNKVFDDIRKELFIEQKNPDDVIEPILVKRDENGKTQHILTSIYPGVEDGTEEFPSLGVVKQNRIKDSSYPTLYAFLKYASSTSTVIARELFDTQHPSFVAAVKGITKVFSGINPELDEATYDDVQKYALSSIYNNVESIRFPIIYVKNENGTDEIHVDINGDTLAERARIFGFGQAPSLKFVEYEEINDVDENGNVTNTIRLPKFIPFTVKNINNPTQDEIKAFQQFSPAQKVQWIKSNFRNAGLFDMLQVNLYNDKRRGYRNGTQSIEFTEQNMNANVIYHEFYKLFTNKNPLVKLAAFDVVKYAVTVEGLRMTNRGVSKIIHNDVFLNDFGLNGTGFVKMVDDRLSTLGTNASDFSDEREGGFLNKIYENYLRSHPKVKGIRNIRLNKTNMTKFGMSFSGDGILFLPVDKSEKVADREKARKQWEERMSKAGLMTHYPVSNTYRPNKYVRYGTKKGSFLYKIVPIKDVNGNILSLFCYPLNPLETNETSDLSARQMNNSYYPQPEVYEALIRKYKKELRDNFDLIADAKWVGIQTATMKETGEYVRYYVNKGYGNEVATLDFDMEKLASEGNGGMIEARYKIVRYFSSPRATDLYINSAELSKYIFVAHPAFASTQAIKMENGKYRNFIINKVNMSAFEDKYLTKRNGVYYMSDERFNDEIKNEKNPQIQKAIIDARASRLTKISNLFVVSPEIEEDTALTMAPAVALEEDFDEMEEVVVEDSLTKNMVNAVEYMIVDSKHGNEDANKAIGKLNIRAQDNKEDYVKGNTETAIREIANYANHKAVELKAKFDRFIEDPLNPNTFIPITDPRIQKMLEGNEALIDKYLEVTNDTRAFLDRFSPFIALDVNSEDTILNSFINDIKKATDMVSKLPLENANLAFANGYATRITTNPLVKSQLIKVMDGFYKIYGAMWRFHDIMENGNPLLQTILTDVMGDLDAKRLAKIDMLRKYRKEIERIKKEAREHSFTIDINKFIDKEGRFVEDYSNEFIDTLHDLYSAKAQAAKEHGLGSIQHLKAKLEYDEFKAKHCNQEVIPRYYLAKCQNERLMIEHHPVIYEAYMTKYYQKLDLLNYISEIGINEDLQEKLNKIDGELNMLKHRGYYVVNGTFTERPTYDPENATYDPQTLQHLLLNSNEEVEALNGYIESTKRLNEKYFEYDAVHGFEDHLKMCLNIVRNYEHRDGSGIPTVPQEELERNPKYVEAKNWIRKNARFVIDQSEASMNNPNSIGSKLTKAFQRLKLAGNRKSYSFNQYVKTVEQNKQRELQDFDYSVRDENGVIDGSLFTPEEVAEIKRIQARNYNIENCPPNTDRILISSARKNDVQYTAEFYAKLKTDGFNNPDYLAIVTELNHYLEPYYVDGIVHLDRIPDTEEGIALLNKIGDLYLELKNTASRRGGNEEVAEAAQRFREEHCEYDVNLTACNVQLQAAFEKSEAYKEAFKRVAFEQNRDGSLQSDQERGGYVANRKLFCYIKPKGEPGTEEHDRWVDQQRTEDVRLVNQYYRKVKTKYYYQAMRDAELRAQTDPNFSYEQWYQDNHIYNPFTRKYEPLPIWTTTEPNDQLFEGNELEGKWVPSFKQRERKIRDGWNEVVNPLNGEVIRVYNQEEDYVNHNYNPNKTVAGNYIKGIDNGRYDNNVALNEYEIQMRDYLKRILMDTTANNSKAKRYFERGYLPTRADYKKPIAKRALKEAGKLFGLALDNRKDNLEWHEAISYDKDEIPLMPMTELLSSKELGSTTFDEEEPKPEQYANEENPAEAYREAHEAWEERKREVDAKNREVHQQLLDRNWLSVIEEYLSRAADYNAVQDNKQKLYYLLNMLQKQQVYMREHGISGKLKKDYRRGSKKNPVYEQTVDKDLIEQYTTFMRRILFDQWKENEGGWVKFGNRLQNFTSANYMMLNVRSGIANVTLGETGILAEAAAREYISYADWGFGTLEWNKGVIGFIQGMYRETAVNKQDAITKYFKVVDYDELTGVSREIGMEKYSKRVRDAMFSPQTIGEHYMQNAVLFGMLNSHKIISLENDPRGIGYIYMNEAEYIRYRQAQELNNILTDDQKRAFAKFKEDIKNDKDELAEYAWWRRDVLTDFIYLHCTKEQQNRFLKDRKAQEKKFKEEFDREPNLYSQLTLDSDGYMGFKPDSKLAELQEALTQDGKLTKTQWLMGRFAERVRKVNNKIHGVYNRKGQAWIERKWYGSLVMQYHKHLPMGLLKRYRARGFYSESRGTTEKGMLQSISDFLSLNMRKIKQDNNWTEDNVNAMESLQFLIRHSIDYLGQLRTTLRFLPERERANMLRNLGDLVGVIAALCTTIALLAMGDDDDDGLAYNMMLYEADRLGSEAFLYNPLGMWTETKKLMSTPIAAQSIVGDAFSAIGNICGYIMGGEDYNMIYQSGRFAGRNKLSVYLERRIPIWNGIRSVIDTPSNNHYYKLGDTAMTLVPTKDIANWITND